MRRRNDCILEVYGTLNDYRGVSIVFAALGIALEHVFYNYMYST